MADQDLPGGWLPPQAPTEAQPPRTPVFVPEEGTSPFAIAAVVCGVSSLGLLVLSLGLSFILSLPLGLTGLMCVSRAPKDVRPGQLKTGQVLSLVAVVLSVTAALVWVALMAAGFSPDELQHSLQQELERQRQSS